MDEHNSQTNNKSTLTNEKRKRNGSNNDTAQESNLDKDVVPQKVPKHNCDEADVVANNKSADCSGINGQCNGEGGEKDDTFSILNPKSTLDETESLSASYENAQPYQHGLLKEVFVSGFLEQVLDEIKSNSKVNFKESDLFRVYQSIDLANLEEGSALSEKVPSLMRLRRTLYSSKFRSFIEKISLLEPGTLTEQVDCAANCHTQGCHLLCHDDVIGTRKVSYIIYLTDPTQAWKDEHGGKLELYESTVEERIVKGKSEEGENECEEKRVPHALPSTTILPEFNSLAYFCVSPGESFHSVQEVFGEEPRLSIQGWYHATKPPENIHKATLSRLKSTEKGEDTEGQFRPLGDDDEILRGKGDNPEVITKAAAKKTEAKEDNATASLSAEDVSYLRKYVNGVYLKKESINDIRERFEEDSSVQLRHFLNEAWIDRIKAAALKQDEDCSLGKGRPPRDYAVGANDNWKATGPAHKQRFLEYVGNDQTNDQDEVDTKPDCPGPSLLYLKSRLFASPPFRRLLALMTSLGEATGYRGRIRRFRPGLDYTVAHYGILTTTSVLDATLCFASGQGKQCRYDEATGELLGSDDDALWESGDVGGFECYIAAADQDDDKDRKQEADAEYDAWDDSELLSVSACNGTLSLVYRDPGTMRFVKYVGCNAPSSRWDLGLEYQLPPDSDSENDEVTKQTEAAES